MHSDEQAFLELCGIVDSLAGRPSVDQIARFKYELSIALEQRVDCEQHLHAGRATVADGPHPSEADRRLRGMRRPVQLMLDTCAHLHCTSGEVVRSLAEVENRPPALLPPVRP